MGRGKSKVGNGIKLHANEKQKAKIEHMKATLKRQGNGSDYQVADNPEKKGDLIYTYLRHYKKLVGFKGDEHITTPASRRMWGVMDKDGNTHSFGFSLEIPQTFANVFKIKR